MHQAALAVTVFRHRIRNEDTQAWLSAQPLDFGANLEKSPV